MHRHPTFVGHILRFVGMAVLITGVFGFAIQQLWNALMPYLFHLPAVGFWQAFGLAVLSRLLFGHVGGRHHGGHRGFGPFARHGMPFGPFGFHRHDGHRDFELEGGPQGWRRYGTYWKEEGKNHFEGWLQRSEELR